MTINTDLSRQQHLGNSVTTAFPFATRILDAAHIIVTRTVIATGANTTLILNDPGADGYSVAGVGDPSTTINTVSAPATGTRLTIVRNVPLTQTADYVENDPFPAKTHEDALDKLTMENQQLSEKQDRTLGLAATTAFSGDLLMEEPVAGALLGWNATANGIANYLLASTALTPVSTYMATVLLSSNAAAARTALGVTAVPYTAPTTTVGAYVDFAEGTNNGTNRLRLRAPDTLSFDADVFLPFAGGILLTQDNAAPITNKVFNGALNTVSNISMQFSVTDVLQVANGGTGDSGTGWASSSPVVTATTGSITSYTSTLKTRTIGKTLFFNLFVHITNIGTASNDIRVAMPFTASTRSCFCGREVGVTGFAITCDVGVYGFSTMQIKRYDNVFIGVTGSQFSVTGVVETT